MEYIERKVKIYFEKNEYSENIENVEDGEREYEEYSEKIILENRISVIIGESGRGKSSLLKNIEKNNNNAMYIKVVDINDEINTLNGDMKVYLLDSIDEAFQGTTIVMTTNKLNKLINKILSLNEDNKIIITSRYYTGLEYEHTTYELLSLTKEEINYLLEKKGKNEEEFWSFIENSGLEEHLGNIVILEKMIEKYKEYSTDATKANIYKELCKDFLKIETSNDNNFKGENIEILLEELAILATTKKFHREFPNSSFKLKDRILEKSKKEKLEQTPFFRQHKMEFLFYHRSIEEFLVAYFFHKKLEYKEIDFKNLNDIFFNEKFLKKDLKEILEFLMELESDEFKSFMLNNNCLNFIELQNLDDRFQMEILEKSIKLLKEEPYHLWGNIEILDKAKIDKNLNVDIIFKKNFNYENVNNETFYYLMFLLKKNYNKSLEKFIITILESRIMKCSNLDEILGGVFIEEIDFLRQIDIFLRNKKKKLKSDYYFLPKFIIFIYPIIGRKILFYLEIIEHRELENIKEKFTTDDLLYFYEEFIKGKEYGNIKKSEILIKEILKREGFHKNKGKILTLIEKDIMENSLINTNILKLLREKIIENERIEYLDKYFKTGKLKFLCILNEKDNINIKLKEILIYYKIEENLLRYYYLDNYFSNSEVHMNLINNIDYLQVYEKKTKEKLDEEMDCIDSPQENKKRELDALIKKYNNKKTSNKLLKKYNKKTCEILIEIIFKMVNFYDLKDIYIKLREKMNNKIELINKEMIKYFFYKDIENDEFLILIAFSYIESLSMEELKKIMENNKLEVLIENTIAVNNYRNNNDEIIKFLFCEENRNKSFEIIKKIFLYKSNSKFVNIDNFIQSCFNKFSEKEKDNFIKILESNCINSNLEPEKENSFLNIILKNNNKENFIDKKLIEKENKLNAKFIQLYIDYRGINKFIELVNFDRDIDIEKFKIIINTLYFVKDLKNYLNVMEEKNYRKILNFYDKEYKAYILNKKLLIEDEKKIIDNFIFYKLLDSLIKNGDLNIIKKLLSHNFDNERINYFIKFAYKKKLESEISRDEVAHIIEKSKFNSNNFKFDYEKFLEDLIIVIEHITEMRGLIINKNFNEDNINDLICFGLEMRGYKAQGQRRGGESESEISTGERDFVIKNGDRISTILEALLLEDLVKKKIKSHYRKLNKNYDTIGNLKNYFLCYYKGKNFELFYKKYIEASEELFKSKYEKLLITGEDKENIKIIKTTVNKKEIFHFIINFKL